MSFEPSDFAALLERRRAQGPHRPPIEVRKQAAVAMERLTGQPEWDYFLSRLEARLQALAAEMDQSSDVLLGDQTDPEQILAARFRFLAARAGRDQLDWAMGLPAEIVADARTPEGAGDE